MEEKFDPIVKSIMNFWDTWSDSYNAVEAFAQSADDEISKLNPHDSEAEELAKTLKKAKRSLRSRLNIPRIT